MLRTISILFLILLSSTLIVAQGSSIGTAVAVSPTGSAVGLISDASRDHYWKVTTLTDGYVRVQFHSDTTIDIDVKFYDTNGTSIMSGDSRYGTYSELFGFLKPGTYYINAYRDLGTSGSYTITASFVSPNTPGDQEVNDSPANALALKSVETATGHIGYFGTGTSDTEDYWKITTTEDGWLRVQVRSDSLDARGDQYLELDVALYDVNGTSFLSRDARYGTFSEVNSFVRPGTYCVRVYRDVGRAGGYQIKSEFFMPPRANDVEGNDSPQTASTAILNGSVSGHIGYYSNGTGDTQDYWRFTTTVDGKVTIQVTSDSIDRSGATFDLDLALYDINGTFSVERDGRLDKYSECTSYLRPGTYYARVYRDLGNAGSYSLTLTHTPAARANDVEGNDWFANATSLSFNAASTGHTGYYSNGTTDTRDYWRLTAPSSDSIYVHVSSDTTLDLDLTAYGQDSVSTITSDGRYGTYSRLGIKPIAGSTYYVRVIRSLGTAGSYWIIATRSSLAVGVEKVGDNKLVPTQLTLDQNYPNPFNPTTTIRYGLPSQMKVRVSVYSILGQEVAVIVNATQSPATYTAVWNGKNQEGIDLPSGMYIIRLQAGEDQIVKKAMLVR